MRQVLDTRFFIEHFYSDDLRVRKKTRDKLRELARTGEGIIPALVLAEVVKVTCERRGAEEARIRYFSMMRSGLEVVDITAEIAKEAGLLRCRYKALPMGDCIIAAVAIRRNASLISDDPHFDIVKEVRRAWF